MDNDGDFDVLSGSSGKTAWYENDGNGNFGDEQVIANENNVLAYDFDNDGDYDVVTFSYSTIMWYENDGSGNFGPQLVITTAERSLQSIYVADIDNDGDFDVFFCL